MPYSAQAQLSMDGLFINRVSSCAAVEVDLPADPRVWAQTNIWRIAASPGFAEAYEYAINSNNPQPGNDPSVITDAQILSAVQDLLGKLEAPVP